MKKIIVFAICAIGFAFAAQAQTSASAAAADKTPDQIAAEKNTPTAITASSSGEKKQCAGTAKTCQGSSTAKSCCKAKTGEASAAEEKKSCCKQKGEGSSCKGHETSTTTGEKKSCAKPCCKKS
jgi:hypothetical protein